MESKKFRVFDIEWDADEDILPTLPKTMEVTVTSEDVEDLNDQEEIDLYIENHLSDETGFCHYGFQVDEMYND